MVALIMGGQMLFYLLCGCAAICASVMIFLQMKSRRRRSQDEAYRLQKQAEHAVKWEAMISASKSREAGPASELERLAA